MEDGAGHPQPAGAATRKPVQRYLKRGEGVQKRIYGPQLQKARDVALGPSTTTTNRWGGGGGAAASDGAGGAAHVPAAPAQRQQQQQQHYYQQPLAGRASSSGSTQQAAAAVDELDSELQADTMLVGLGGQGQPAGACGLS